MSSSPRLSHLPAHRQPAWRAPGPALLSLGQLFEGRNRSIEPITLTTQLPEHILDIHDGHSPDGRAKREAARRPSAFTADGCRDRKPHASISRLPLSLPPAPGEASAATEQDEP